MATPLARSAIARTAAANVARVILRMTVAIPANSAGNDPDNAASAMADGMTPNGSFDAIVVGSGAAGLPAALTTARAGPRTIARERTGAIGGRVARGRWRGSSPRAPR